MDLSLKMKPYIQASRKQQPIESSLRSPMDLTDKLSTQVGFSPVKHWAWDWRGAPRSNVDFTLRSNFQYLVDNANVCGQHHCSGRSVTAKNAHTTNTTETRSFTAIVHVGFVVHKVSL